MKPDLRDLFAMHFAAALAREERHSLEFIAGRAYDLAAAMLAERERRIDAEVRAADDSIGWVGAGDFAPRSLLDEPAPPSDPDELDPSWLDPGYDPSWDADKGPMERGSDEAPEGRPGLARTNGDPPADPSRRSA